MSEPYSSDVAPPEEIPPIPQMGEPPVETPKPARPGWVAPAWFFFGILVGVLGFAAYSAFMTKSAPLAAAPVQVAAVDSAMVRSAARDGVIEAIATLQAGGPQQPAAQESQDPQPVAKDAFTVREANRLGNQAAKVTVFEFSDFQ